MHGVLLLDKPLGLSSNQALQKAKWLLRADKAGHTGTLDPLATGVLPLCFGAATKFSQLQLDADKTYEAVLLLGQKTSTADAEGEVIETRPVPPITPELLAEMTRRFTGPTNAPNARFSRTGDKEFPIPSPERPLRVEGGNSNRNTAGMNSPLTTLGRGI